MSKPISLMLMPSEPLLGCVSFGVFRDTRCALLGDSERFNHIPVSPLFAVTYVIDGDLHLVENDESLARVRQSRPLPRAFCIPPRRTPICTWSPGPLVAITIEFYPEAWALLGFGSDQDITKGPLREVLSNFDQGDAVDVIWNDFNKRLFPLWQRIRDANGATQWSGSERVSDWSRSLLNKVSTDGETPSTRTMERRLKRLSGQTKQSLNFYAALEEFHRILVSSPSDGLAELASDAGYSDQSHMGRAIRRATGFSPGKLIELIETDEAFWYYRLMGERF